MVVDYLARYWPARHDSCAVKLMRRAVQVGDVWYAGTVRITVEGLTRVGVHADIVVEEYKPRASYTRRQPLPFPGHWYWSGWNTSDGVGVSASYAREQAVRIAELEAALEAKRAEHAETLDRLEHAFRVIDQAERHRVREDTRYERLLGALWKSRRWWQRRAPGGFLVGYIVRNPHDRIEIDANDEPMFDAISHDLHTDLAAARAELAEARGRDPWASLYALTEITEGPPHE